jgi:hypothetical protein
MMVLMSASFCRVPDLVFVSTERQKRARAIVTAMTLWTALPCRVVLSKLQPRYANRTNSTPYRVFFFLMCLASSICITFIVYL